MLKYKQKFYAAYYMNYAKPMANLIDCLKQLPGIGPKSAQRLAMHIFSTPDEDASNIIKAIEQAKSSLRYCEVCHNISGKACLRNMR